MANYGYIYLNNKISSEDFEITLKKAVKKRFKDKMQVERTELNDDGPVWFVFIPNSAPTKSEAPRFNKAQENFRFPVCLQKSKTIAFRHVFNSFERWCQGCIEEELSDIFNSNVYYDSTDEFIKPYTRKYRSRKSFGGYLSRNLKKPLSEEDQNFIDRHKTITPEGWW